MTTPVAQWVAACPESVQHFINNFIFSGTDCETCRKWRARVLGVGAATLAGTASWLYIIYPLAQRLKLWGMPHPDTSRWLSGDKEELEKFARSGEKQAFFATLRSEVGPNCFLRLPLQFSPCALFKNPFGLVFVTSDWLVVQELCRASSDQLVRNPEWVHAFELIPKSLIALRDEQVARVQRRLFSSIITHNAAVASHQPFLQLLEAMRNDLARVGDRRAIDALQLARIMMFNYWLNILTGRRDAQCLRTSGVLALNPKPLGQEPLPHSTVEALLTLSRFHEDNYERLFLPTDSSEMSRGEHKAMVEQYKEIVNATPVLLSELLDASSVEPLFTTLIAAKESGSRRGFNPDEIRDNASLLLKFADDTALPIVWALFELAKSRTLQEQMYAAVAARPVDVSSIISTEELVDQLGEVVNLVLETLRFYAVPVLSRTAATTIRLTSADLVVPSGTLVLVDHRSITRDPALWGVDADCFDPSRFIGRPWQQAPWLPFGFGPRKCLGSMLALTHAAVFLAFIIEHFTISIDPNSVFPVPVERMFLTPDKPVMLRFYARK